MEFFSDRRILLGVGIGIILGASVMSGVKFTKDITDTQIEERARKLGMKFPDEVNVINSKEVK